jgi:hypothetical protein
MKCRISSPDWVGSYLKPLHRAHCPNLAPFYLDLLFYHRKLHRLVTIALKLGAFTAADKGQIELYPRWLDTQSP